MQIAKLPMVKVSGDVGGLIEISDELQPGLEYYVGVSDGTLLKGVTGQGFSVESAGSAEVSVIDGVVTEQVFSVGSGGSAEVNIANGVVTIEGPVTWVMLSSPEKCADLRSTIEFRGDQAAMLRGEPEEEKPEA